MATDVIIDPSSGQIYWNDGTGSPQSISLGGNAQDTITVTGYGAAYSPGSAVGGTTVLVRFKDSALETLAPGTNGYELGSSTLRWKFFDTTGNFSDSTNSTSLTSGAFQIQGGIAVSGNASFGQTLLFWTPGGVNYIGFRAPASAGNTTYVLPSAAPISGATGTSVLSSDQSGILSWVPMTASSSSGLATTAQNVQVTLVGNSNTFHSVLLTPTISAAGSAVSGNGTLNYNTQTDILSTPGLAVTSGVNAASTVTGAFQVKGGIGISGNAFIGGTINVASPLSIPNGGTNVSSFGQTGGFVYYDGGSIRLLAATGASINFTNGYYQFDNRVYASSFFAGGSQMPNGSGVAGRVTIWSGNNTIGSDADFTYDSTNNIFTVLGNINGIGFTASGVAVTSTAASTSTTTGALVVTGGVGIGGSLYVSTSVPSNISGINIANGILSGTALTAPSVTTTNIRTTASTLNIVDTGTSNTVLNYNGTRFGVLITANSTTSSDGGLVTTGGAGFGASINVNGNISARAGYELRVYNPGDTAYTGFDFTGSASTTYILPLTSPATGSSVLQSTAGGVMSWVPMTAGGGGAPGGAIGDIQLNSGASTFTTLNSSYLNVSTTTGMMKHIGYNVSGTSNSATVNAFLLGSDGSGTFSGQSRGTLLALDNTSGNGITYNFIDAQYYDGTPSQKSVFKVDYLGRIVHADLTVTGSNYSGTRFSNTLKTSTSQSTNVVYTFPLAAPGAGQTFLTADTAGNMYWVATPAGGSATPSGSNRQIQYNNSSAFGGATGFEYVSAGSAVTVSYFSAAGGGNTVGMVICTVNATTTRVGIGLTNPAFELEIRGEISATNKSFVIDHPTKPGMKLRYGSLEGPENGVYVRGQLLGTNIIETPDYWRGLVHDDSYTIHLTPNGNYQQLYVDKIQDYKVYVGTASTFEINCFYSIWAERKDISKLKVEY